MTFEEFILKVGEFEGFRSKKYLDPAGIPTIGYGFTSSVFPNGVVPDTITKDSADVLLATHLKKVAEQVEFYLTRYEDYKINNNQLLALTDFSYNCGIGNLYKLTNYGKRNLLEIADHIRLYNKAGGKTLNGLVKRRQWEYELFTNEQSFEKLKVPTSKDIQKLLNDRYGYKLVIDGKIGELTRTAIYNELLK